jgi:hypothetical protein
MPVPGDSLSYRDIDTALAEDRRFPPDEVFAAAANADASIYDWDFDEFWTREARTRISWFRDFHTLYELYRVRAARQRHYQCPVRGCP